MFLHRSRRLDHEEKENVSHRRTKTSAAGDLPENMMEHTCFQRGVTGYGSDVVVLKDGQAICAFPMNYFEHLHYFCSLFSCLSVESDAHQSKKEKLHDG